MEVMTTSFKLGEDLEDSYGCTPCDAFGAKMRIIGDAMVTYLSTSRIYITNDDQIISKLCRKKYFSKGILPCMYFPLSASVDIVSECHFILIPKGYTEGVMT